MSNFNSQHNRVVWIDIPVADLDRAAGFYGAVLDIKIHHEEFGGFKFCVLDHHEGNGGCLVLKPSEVSASGTMIYLNCDGRLRDAVSHVERLGGQVIEPIHNIGPHGFRAVILDSEGNRLALHSNTDA